MATENKLNPICNIQVLRAVAASLVLFVHQEKVLATIHVHPFGQGGVDLFFVISGFIMSCITSKQKVTPLSFMLRRIGRIVPLYWAITLIVFAIALVHPSSFLETKADWGGLVLSLCFIPFARSNGTIEPILYVGWTLNFEMFFYLLFALGLMIKNRFWSQGLIIFTLSGLCILGILGFNRGTFGRFYTNPHMLEFVSGMLIAATRDRLPLQVRTLTKAAVSVVIIGALLSLVLLPVASAQTPAILTCGLPATVVTLCAVALERWQWRVTSPLLLLLGNASYSIYLTHPFLIRIIELSVDRLRPHGYTTIVLILLAVTSAYIIGILTHLKVELPLSKRAQEWLTVKTRENAASPTASCPPNVPQ